MKLFLLLSALCLPAVMIQERKEGKWFLRRIGRIPEALLPEEDTILSGINLSQKECQRQFQWRRWNCPSSEFERSFEEPKITREISFVQAVSSSGVTFAMAKKRLQMCLLNSVSTYSKFRNLVSNSTDLMDDQTFQTWFWNYETCNLEHFLQYGMDVSSLVFRGLPQAQDLRKTVSFHNYEIGRKVLKKLVERKCRCHGISGSCVQKTCWGTVPSFKKVGDKLMKLYRRALKARNINDPTTGIQIHEEKLTYLATSPQYCQPNELAGWKGTLGRTCRKSSRKSCREERKSCKKLCKSCNYSIKLEPTTQVELCSCRFVWCCKVSCNICKREAQVYTCVETKNNTEKLKV